MEDLFQNPDSCLCMSGKKAYEWTAIGAPYYYSCCPGNRRYTGLGQDSGAQGEDLWKEQGTPEGPQKWTVTLRSAEAGRYLTAQGCSSW